MILCRVIMGHFLVYLEILQPAATSAGALRENTQNRLYAQLALWHTLLNSFTKHTLHFQLQ